jgi:hypothetical protein
MMAVIGTGLSAKVYSALYTSQVSDASIVVSNSTTQGRTESVLDFNAGDGVESRDFETAFSWTISAGTILYTWQPTVIENPENTYNRATDWDNAGIPGNKLIRGFVLEMNTLGNAKAIQVQRAEDGYSFTPSESPATTSKQVLKAFSFNPPFVSHNVRITSTDGVAWQHGPDGGWKMSWIADPWVEYATLRSEWSNLGTPGAKYIRGLVLPMDTQGAAATINVVTSDSGTIRSVTATVEIPPGVQSTNWAGNYPLVFTESGGSGAAGFATIATNTVLPGSISQITLTDHGGGYSSASLPNVTITGGGGSGATAVAVYDIGGRGDLASITVTNGGSGYTSAPTVTIDAPGGSISQITLTDHGGGYSSASLPNVTITGGGGSGATAVAVYDIGGRGDLASITVTNGGSGYTSAPTVTIDAPPAGPYAGQATATATIGTNPYAGQATATATYATSTVYSFSSITTAVTSGGTGYTSDVAVTSPTIPYGSYGFVATGTTDGESVTFTATTSAAVKTPISFAFTPPIVAHEVQIQVQTATAGVWLNEARWDFEPYPEIIPEYTPILEAGGAGAKYFRGMTLTADTSNVSTSFQILYDGGQSGPTLTAAFNGKQTKAFAFTPFVFHDIQLVPQANARVWIADSKWDSDPYPEIIPEYTPIMEVNGSGAKLMRGLNITGDTANVSTSFVISYDGGQTGPTVTASFNGKQTKAFAFTPFIAHDIQLIPQSAARIWLDSSKWDMDPWPEYTALYSPWMNLGTNGAKYIRSLVLPMDTNGSAAVVNILTSDGATIPLAATTTPSGVKTQVAFAFTPPFIAHEVRFVPQNPVGIWSEEAKFDFDPYPEIIPAYTPIMEIGGDDNKFVQGVKLLADTGNLPVTFQVLYDGGQTGPTFTGTFNGKQTLIFSWTPFLAHDIQLVPQANARIWWGVVGQGESEWVSQPFSEAAKIWQTELTSQGGVGWQHLRYINIEYISTNPITLTFVTDSGNGSIAPSTITVPSSGGTQTKLKITVSPNKWKLLSMGATSSTSFYLMTEGMEFYCRSWNSSENYRVERPFGGKTSGGAEV